MTIFDWAFAPFRSKPQDPNLYPYYVRLTGAAKAFGEPPSDNIKAHGVTHEAAFVARALLTQCIPSFTVVEAQWVDDGEDRVLYFVYKRPGFRPEAGNTVIEAGFAVYDGPA